MATRQDSRIDVALRSVWARGAVAMALAATGAWAWWLAFVYVRDDLDLAIVAWPVGLVVALLLYLGVGLTFRRFGPKAAPTRMSHGNLARNLQRRLDALDALTHRRHPLGRPFPIAVVSRSGVHLLASAILPGTLTEEAGEVRYEGRALAHPGYTEIRRLVPTVRDLLVQAGVALPVQGVVVVDDATVVPMMLQAGDRDVQFVHVDQVPDTVSFAPSGSEDDVVLAVAALQRWRPARR